MTHDRSPSHAHLITQSCIDSSFQSFIERAPLETFKVFYRSYLGMQHQMLESAQIKEEDKEQILDDCGK